MTPRDSPLLIWVGNSEQPVGGETDHFRFISRTVRADSWEAGENGKCGYWVQQFCVTVSESQNARRVNKEKKKREPFILNPAGSILFIYIHSITYINVKIYLTYIFLKYFLKIS